MTTIDDLTRAAETEWLGLWTSGPVETERAGLATGDVAPDLELLDHTGTPRRLSEFWTQGPALVLFWRHFGCGCGAQRATRLIAEHDEYVEAGLQPVIVAQGEPERAAAYRKLHGLPCPILCDPDHTAYRAYGLGHWPVARVLFDAPAEYWSHAHDLGASFQDDRRAQGNPPVDDPWRATAEYVVGTDGAVVLEHRYQHCVDFPDARVLTTAARVAGSGTGR
jgi:peroxiredoxin